MGIQSHVQKLWETNGCCIYCGHRLSIEEVTIDHIVPLSKGGVNEDMNKVASCVECNQRKGDMLPWAFLSTFPLRKKRSYENRVIALFDQSRISKEKRDLLLDKPKRLVKASNLSIRLFGHYLKVAFFLRKD